MNAGVNYKFLSQTFFFFGFTTVFSKPPDDIKQLYKTCEAGENSFKGVLLG